MTAMHTMLATRDQPAVMQQVSPAQHAPSET